MKKWYVTFMMVVLAWGLVVAQNDKPVEQGKEEKAVSAAVEALRKAMIDPDKATLEKLMMPELSYGHSDGLIQTRSEFIEMLLSGRSDFVSIELTGQTITIVNNTAVVRHILSADTNDGGKPAHVNLSVLLVWQKQKGEWRLLARQTVKVKQAL